MAHCESYVIVILLNTDGKSVRIISGRYLDRLERRQGEWRIAVRRSAVEVVISADAGILQSPAFKEQGYIKGLRNTNDISYSRPLSLDDSVQRWA